MSYFFNGISLRNKRHTNMDSLLLTKRNINKKDVFLAAVSDGVGSFVDGAYASGIAVKMLNIWFNKLIDTKHIGLKMRDAVLDINTHIILNTERENINTGSTLSALLITDGIYYIVHVGDSRIYSYENGKLSLLTDDNVTDDGKLTACIGQIKNVTIQYYEGATKNKVFLLCTDGLYKRMDIDFVINRIKKMNKQVLNETVKAFVKHVIEHGEQDNITFALIKIGS